MKLKQNKPVGNDRKILGEYYNKKIICRHISRTLKYHKNFHLFPLISCCQVFLWGKTPCPSYLWHCSWINASPHNTVITKLLSAYCIQKHHVAPQIVLVGWPNYTHISFWLNPTGHSKFHNTSNIIHLLPTPVRLLVLSCTRQCRQPPSYSLPPFFFFFTCACDCLLWMCTLNTLTWPDLTWETLWMEWPVWLKWFLTGLSLVVLNIRFKCSLKRVLSVRPI